MSSFKDFCAGIPKKWCANFRSNAKKDGFLPRERYRYVKAWFYFTKPGHYLLSQICWCKILSVDGRRSGPFANSLRCFWWSIFCFFLHAKEMLMKVFFQSLQTYANLLLAGLIPANYIPIQYVNLCLSVVIRVGISNQTRVDSQLDKTRRAALKKWSIPISNEQDQNVKLITSLKQADRRKLTSSVLMGFVFIATLCSKSWVAFITSVLVRSCVPLSLKRIFEVVAKRESSMCSDNSIYKRKAARLLKCGSAIGGYWTKQPILLNIISEKTFFISVDLQLSNF